MKMSVFLKFYLQTIILVFSAFLSSVTFGQSALGQLETLAGQQVNVPAASSPSSNNNYAANRQALKEYREQQRHIKANETNEQGVAEYRSSNWKTAYKLFKKAHRLYPENTVFYQNLQNAKEKLSIAKQKDDDEKNNRKEQALRIKEQEEYDRQQEKKRDQQLKQEEADRKQKEEDQLAAEKAKQEIISKKIKEAQEKISGLQKDIKGIQGTLKVYSQSLRNNSAEFEKWGNTVDVAYNNVLENTKDEIKDLFVQYSLLAVLGPATQKAAFSRIRAIIGSNDPQMQKWIAVEARLKGITPDKVEDLIDKVNSGFDLNDLLKGEQSGIKPKLDAMLFVNDLFETFNICDYKSLMEKAGIFGSDKAAGEYFDKAKLIGETYSDLAAICYSWFSINKLTTQNEEFAQQVNRLSNNMEYKMKEIDCLKQCMKNFTKGCNDRCAGKTRFSTPPPPLK